MKILFNVYNISGYLVAELRELVKSADVTVIEVPWEGVSKLDIANTARWIDRRQLSVADMRGLSESGFDAFFCGGWLNY